MSSAKLFHMSAFILLVVGGLNWGFVGLFNFNLVSQVFGTAPQLEQLVYILVGISAVYIFVTHQGECKICKS